MTYLDDEIDDGNEAIRLEYFFDSLGEDLWVDPMEQEDPVDE